MRYNDVAVIGMSVKYAKVNNLEDYHDLLLNGKSGIDLPSKERLNLTEQSPQEKYMRAGYVDDIDKFDYQFFEIEEHEARLTSPEQRICLELVAQAIWDAGYSLEEFAGSNCGVYTVSSQSQYRKFLKRATSTSIIGSESFMVSGKIGYYFDLRGENISLDSGCSSSLEALHLACERISSGEIDTAIVGGISLNVEVPVSGKNDYDILGIMSPDYNIYSFDSRGNGTVFGEGSGFVLLKRKEAAIADNDHIYGVILGGKVNGDGKRSSSATMPSVEAQKEVVIDAWNDIEKIDKLTEIEGHGIGASIGDAVECQGLIGSLEDKGLEKNPIVLSTVKPNIGHLFGMSGMSALEKVLLGYENNVTYPIAGFEKINPVIDLSSVSLEPAKEAKYWAKTDARMTGISAFGLSGCNVHLVLENFKSQDKPNSYPQNQYLIKLSAKTKDSLSELKQRLAKFLQKNEADNFADVVYTLNVGRDDYEHRETFWVSNKGEFIEELLKEKQETPQNPHTKLVFAIKNDLSEPFLATLCQALPQNDVLSHGAQTEQSVLEEKVLLLQYLQKIGIDEKTFFLDEVSNKQIQLLQGKCSKAELEEAKKANKADNDYAKYKQKLKEFSQKEKLVVLDFSSTGELKEIADERITVFQVTDSDDLAQFIDWWFTSGKKIHWSNLYDKSCYHRVSLPTYAFNNQSVWLREVKNEKNEEELTVFIFKATDISVDFKAFPYADEKFKECFELLTANNDINYAVAMYRYLRRKGITPQYIITDSLGARLIDYLKGKTSLDEVSQWGDEAFSLDNSKVATKISDLLTKHKNIRVIDFSNDFDYPNETNDVIVQSPAEVFKQSEQSEATKDLQEPNSQLAPQKTQAIIDAEAFLEKLWLKVFNFDGEIGHQEDFFALGGNSLIMQSMSDSINEHFKMKFDIFEIYDYETIEKLASRILQGDN